MKTNPGGVWLVIYMTGSERQAESAEHILQAEGFLVRRRTLNRAVSGAGTFELQVLASEAEEARQLLMEKGL